MTIGPAFWAAGKLPGAVFNQTTLALDTALAGQGVAIVPRAFVVEDIKAGRLLIVADAASVMAPDYYLMRKRLATHDRAVDAVWHWCLTHLTRP